MSDTESDRIYSAEDVFDPEGYAEIVASISPPSNQRRGRRHSLVTLGGNVIRLLLTYLSADDMIRATGTCRWMYQIGAEPERLRSFGLRRDVSLLSLRDKRRVFIEERREQAFSANPNTEIHQETIYDPRITALFHIEPVGFRSVFFSIYNSQLLCWEYIKSTVRINKRYPGVSHVIGFVILPTRVVLLGNGKVTRLVCDWSNDTYEEVDYKEARLPYSQTGYVKIIPITDQIIVATESLVIVFDHNLRELHRFVWTVINSEFDPISALFTFPSELSFVVVSASKMGTIDPTTNTKLTKSLGFEQIIQAAAHTPKDSNTNYIILLGRHSGSIKLFVNDKVMVVGGATSFEIDSNGCLIVLTPQLNFRVFSLFSSVIWETYSRKYETARSCLSFIPLSDRLITLTTQEATYVDRRYVGKHIKVNFYPPISDTYHQRTYWASLGITQVVKCFAVKNEVVIVGVSSRRWLKCVIIVDYNRKAAEGSEWDSDKAKELEIKAEMSINEWLKGDEQERQNTFPQRRRAGKQRRRKRRINDEEESQ